MADITPVAVTTTLTQRAFSAADAAGDKIVWPGQGQDVLLEFRNSNASARTVTLTAQVSSADVGEPWGVVPISDKQVTLAQDEEAVVRVPRAGFNDPADANKVAISYDDATGVTLRALKL